VCMRARVCVLFCSFSLPWRPGEGEVAGRRDVRENGRLAVWRPECGAAKLPQLGFTALHHAAKKNAEKMARLLLERASDPNAVDEVRGVCV